MLEVPHRYLDGLTDNSYFTSASAFTLACRIGRLWSPLGRLHHCFLPISRQRVFELMSGTVGSSDCLEKCGAGRDAEHVEDF